MSELSVILEKMNADRVYRMVLSDCVKDGGVYQKINIALVEGQYMAEKFTATQVFHQHIIPEDLIAYIEERLTGEFRQVNAWGGEYQYSLRISKKGKILFNRKKNTESAPAPKVTHNREKSRRLPQDCVIPPLVDMGVMTGEGKIISSMQSKFRQINRFLELVEDELSEKDRTLHVVDLCCGKSYLSFVLYYYLVEVKGLKVEMLGLDLKEAVIENCQETAKKYGYQGLRFEVADVNTYEIKGPVDIVVALHACDIATDYVLFNAMRWKAGLIFSVPCCHHELNGQMQSETFALLTRYGIVKERISGLTTDALRANLLAYCGYKTQLLEFIDMEDTPKNIMLRARRTGKKGSPQLLREVEAVIEEFHLNPTLYRLVQERREEL